MIVPTWMVLTGMDDRPVYAKATDVGIIEETPEGSRFLVQGQWAHVKESPAWPTNPAGCRFWGHVTVRR